jgi:hypothetical protein
MTSYTTTAEDLTQLARAIRQWREDIATVRTAGPRNRAALLCYAWNWATNPATLYTAREHRACRRFARWCRRRLDREQYTHWHESDSGRLWV